MAFERVWPAQHSTAHKTHLVQGHGERPGYGQSLAVLDVALDGGQVANDQSGFVRRHGGRIQFDAVAVVAVAAGGGAGAHAQSEQLRQELKGCCHREQ